MESNISHIKKLYYEGNFQTLLEKRLDVDKYIIHQYNLFNFRSLMESGKFQEAHFFIESYLENIDESIMKSEFLLWKIFCEVFVNSASNIQDYIKRVDEVTINSGDNKLKALGIGLKAKLIELGINIGLESSLTKQEVLILHEKSALLYLESDEIEEYLLTTFRIIKLLLKKPFSNPQKAKELLLNLVEKTKEIQYVRLLIDSKLLIAELNFEEAIDNNSIDFNKVQQEYNEIEALCLVYQSERNAINVYFSLGCILLEYGFESGIKLLEEAITRYKKINDFTQQQQAWRNIARWHLVRGEESENIKAEAEVNKLNNENSIKLSTDIETMYNIFVAHKQGDAGYINNLVEKNTLQQNQWSKNLFKTLESQSLISGGRFNEGIVIMKEIVRQYSSVGISPFHSEALYTLSNVLIHHEPNEAIRYMKEAIEIDEVLEDSYALAQRYLQLGSHLFYAKKPNLAIDSEIENCFAKSLEYIGKSLKMDYLVQLGTIYQTQGQLYGIIDNFPKTGELLTKAENVFNNLNIKPQLAFTLSQQGLCLLKIARQYKNLQSFDDALNKFTESASLFRSCSLYTSLWRTIFHQALCKYELAQNLAYGSLEFDESLNQAESFFKEASLIVDELRFVANNEVGVERQVAISSFGKDKQELYLQAFYANYWLKKDFVNALRWLERMKSQAFLEEISSKNITIKRTKTYEDYKTLLIKASNATDDSVRQKLHLEMDNLLSSLFNYSNIEKSERYVEHIADYAKIRQILLQEESKHNGKRIVVVQYFCMPNLTLAFGIRSDWQEPQIMVISLDYYALKAVAQSLFHKPEDVRTLAENQKERFLDEMKSQKITESDFENNWQQFTGLIAPIKDWTEPDDLICLIPHGLLHDLPLHTLKAESNQYFIERNPIFYSLSISIFQLSFQKEYTQNTDKVFVFGNPTNDLSFAENEAVYIAQKLKTTALIGSEATKKSFIQLYPYAHILHFSGHGKAQVKNGLEQYIVLANREHLTAKELFELKTQADLIVLSGCETGINEHQGGDELFGMIRSILHTGANSALVSLWAIKDDSTAKLLMKFYDEYTQQNKAIALQNAMKSMIIEGYGFYHWGAFVLVGVV